MDAITHRVSMLTLAALGATLSGWASDEIADVRMLNNEGAWAVTHLNGDEMTFTAAQFGAARNGAAPVRASRVNTARDAPRTLKV